MAEFRFTAYVAYGEETTLLTVSHQTTKAVLDAEMKKVFVSLKQSGIDYKFTDPEGDIELVLRTEAAWTSAVDVFRESGQSKMKLTAVKVDIPSSVPTKQAQLPFSSSTKRSRSRSKERERSLSPPRSSKRAKDDDKESKEKTGTDKDKERCKESKDRDKGVKGSDEEKDADVVMTEQANRKKSWTPSSTVKGLVKVKWTAQDSEQLQELEEKIKETIAKLKGPASAEEKDKIWAAGLKQSNRVFSSLHKRTLVRANLDRGRAVLSRIIEHGGQYMRHPLRCQCPFCVKPDFCKLNKPCSLQRLVEHIRAKHNNDKQAQAFVSALLKELSGTTFSGAKIKATSAPAAIANDVQFFDESRVFPGQSNSEEKVNQKETNESDSVFGSVGDDENDHDEDEEDRDREEERLDSDLD